jgi:hypothetical protein
MPQANGLAGGYSRGFLYPVLLWALCQGLRAGARDGSVVAKLQLPDVGVGFGE